MSSPAVTLTALSAENWDTETLIIFLRGQNLNLDEDDYEILCKEKIDGRIFPDMTEKKFMEDGMKRGPAIKLDKQARMFKKQTKVLGRVKSNISGFSHITCGPFSISSLGLQICLNASRKMRRIQCFITPYILSVMTQAPHKKFLR